MIVVAGLLFVLVCFVTTTTTITTAQEAFIDSATWEADLIETWRTVGDCSPDTGMCDACGLGLAVIDMNGLDGMETSLYNVGPANVDTAPWGRGNSITKPFTAVAMLILEGEGLLSCNSTIGDLLPCDWDQAASSEVASITLIEMVQHQSGLPAQPHDRGPSIGGTPFANSSEERLCASLLKLDRLPTRGRYLYSNYATGRWGTCFSWLLISYQPTYLRRHSQGTDPPPFGNV